MNGEIDLQKKLDKLRREFRGVRSMLEMMQKGTEGAVLRKLRQEKLVPLEQEIQRLEELLKKEPHSKGFKDR